VTTKRVRPLGGSGGTDEREHPRNPKPDVARTQAATNGSPHPRVLNPGPLPLGPGIETRHTHRSLKASDVPRFWLGRSVARRLLGLAPTAKAGNNATRRRTRLTLLAVRSRTSTAERFPTKTNREKATFTPQTWFELPARSCQYASGDRSKIHERAIATSQLQPRRQPTATKWEQGFRWQWNRK
jgi:hypothetical protein